MNPLCPPLSSLPPSSAAGSAILRFPDRLGTACDALASVFPIPALSSCTTWKAGTKAGPPDLKLALEVAGDCSVDIKPIGDTFCADPLAVAGQAMPAPLSGTYSYSYRNLTMRAYYTSTNRVRMLLPPGDGGARCAHRIYLFSCCAVAELPGATCFLCSSEAGTVQLGRQCLVRHTLHALVWHPEPTPDTSCAAAPSCCTLITCRAPHPQWTSGFLRRPTRLWTPASLG